MDAEHLKRLIADEAVQRKPEGEFFTLRSGRRSPLYFDLKFITLHPLGLRLVSRHVLEEIIEPGGYTRVGGIATGSIPLVAGVVAAADPSSPLRGFYVREEPKGHGNRASVEGPVDESAKIVLVEDVITAGTSVMTAVEHLRDNLGVTPMEIFSIVDRGGGARDRFEGMGVKYTHIFGESDFL